MKNVAFKSIVWLALICCLSITAKSQLDEYGRWTSDIYGEPVYLSFWKFTKEDFQSALETLAAVRGEETTDEWSGMYSARGSEVNRIVFVWAPKSGFVFLNFYTCTPELRAVRFGSVAFRSDRLTRVNGGSASNEKEPEYLAVKWGGRHFLVPEDRVRDFYRFVAGFGWSDDEYVFFDFLEKVGDGANPISGMPVFPPGYERFVKRPVEAAITRVIRREVREEDGWGNSPRRSSFTYVALDKGSRHGLRPGMMMYSTDDSDALKIVKVGPRRSTGVFEREIDDNGVEAFEDYGTRKMVPYPRIVPGWKFTTRSLNLIDDGYKWGT